MIMPPRAGARGGYFFSALFKSKLTTGITTESYLIFPTIEIIYSVLYEKN